MQQRALFITLALYKFVDWSVHLDLDQNCYLAVMRFFQDTI